MSTSTKYIVRDSEGTDMVTKSKKAQAIAAADQLADENRGTTFVVVTSAGTEVHSVGRKPAGSHAAPWTRTDSSDKLEGLTIPKGYVVAYVRTRIPAAVCRAEDKSGWLIVTPEGNHEAKGTVEAREITNDLGAKAKVAREAAQAEAKAEKARLKQEAKDAKEAEKAAAADAEVETAEVA
jgi:hypothetical protein